MQLYDVADYTGLGTVVSLASILGFAAGATAKAKYIQVTGLTIGATAARIGSASISATRGFIITGGGSQFVPPIAQGLDFYDMQNIYLLLQVGDTAAVAYAI